MPAISSGLVSNLTSITLSPAADNLTASSDSRTILPDTAPGDAGIPLIRKSDFALLSKVG